MAKLNYSGVGITGGSGRLNSGLGGSVLTKNGHVRSYVTPSNPQTPKQMAQRALMASASGAWGGLTDTQRQSFVDAAAGGDWLSTDVFRGVERNLTGRALFIQLYLNISIAGGAVAGFVAVPSKIDMGDAVVFFAGGATPTVEVHYNGSLLGGAVLVCYATPSVSAGRMKVPGGTLRYVTGQTTASPQDISPEYSVALGVPVSGKKIFFQFEVVSPTTGQRSPAGNYRFAVT